MMFPFQGISGLVWLSNSAPESFYSPETRNRNHVDTAGKQPSIHRGLRKLDRHSIHVYVHIRVYIYIYIIYIYISYIYI